jgi:hypothetical protein
MIDARQFNVIDREGRLLCPAAAFLTTLVSLPMMKKKGL